MSNVPLGRMQLNDIADLLEMNDISKTEAAQQIRVVVAVHLCREKKVRRAPTKSQPVTPEMRAQIFQLARTNMHMSEIGHRLGINQGRVSEILNGKR